MGRLGYIQGQGVPQFWGMAPVELFPYVLDDQSLFFSDLRVFPTTLLTFGGNAGLGYRYYSEALNRVFGASAWYDGDNTRNFYFQQAGLSLETYGTIVDFRTNLYLPVGATSHLASLDFVNGSTQFTGDNLTYGQQRTWYAAMKGFDMEAGLQIPGDFFVDHGVRLYGGGYYYRDDDSHSITGASTRLVANLLDGIDAQVQVTHDNYFQTRAFFGISWTLGALHRSELKQTTAYGRIGEHVTRNYTVVAPQRIAYDSLTAINPGTGQPYTFAHVASSAATGGTGTVDRPFQTISAAQGAGRDIVFVHAGSVFSGPNASLVLNPGTRLFGDGAGVQHFLPIQGHGSLLLPQAAASGALPILNGAPGDSLVLASGVQISGLSIVNSGGNGIVGNGVQNVTIDNVSINHTGLDGIRLLNIPDPISITGMSIANTAGAGINIAGATGQIQFLGTTTVSGASGPAVTLTNLAPTGNVSFANLNIDHRGSQGMEINGSAGTVTVSGTTNISNELASTASAIEIQNSPGTTTFNTVNVAGATGAPGVNLANNTNGTTMFQTLNIASQNGTALRAVSAGALIINPAVNNAVNASQGGTINAVGGTALDIQNTFLNVNLQSVSASGAATGISLVNTGGALSVFGNGTVGSGGTITATTTAIFLQNVGTASFDWMTISGNGVGIHSQNVATLLVSDSSITNSTSFGIDALDTQALYIANSGFSGNGAANLRAQFDVAGSYAYSIGGSTFTSSSADNIDVVLLGSGVNSTMNLVVQGDTFTNTLAGTAGLNVNWNGTLSANIDQSGFFTTGSTDTGVLVTNASNSGSTSFWFTNSTFSPSGPSSVGVHLVTAASAQATFANDQIAFGGSSGTGFEMSLLNPSVNIANNTFSDTTDGATAILFDSLTGPGSVTINNNSLNLSHSGPLLVRGIIFSNVTNSIQLQSTFNNTVTNADTPFSVPAGTTTGSILVNGTPLP